MKTRLLLMVCTLITLFAIGSASATPPAGSSNNYLALGDSIVFGYITEAGYDYYYPTNFVGYGDWDSLALGLNLANGGCPGETTGSFLSRTAPDNGCRAYRALFPLHVIYPSVNATQLAYATSYLKQNTSVALVTIQLGANDILLLEQQCNNDPTCIENGAPQVFATAEANMTTSLAALRATGYSGPIIVLNYYSPDYSNQFDTEITEGLNQAITAPAPAYGAVVADVFSAFEAASSNPFAGGQTCVAGLLAPANPQTSPPTCDDHPSQYGHKLTAQVVAAAYQERR
jgi:lysophospholipase L1-like esterase